MEPFDWTCPFCDRDTTITANNQAVDRLVLFTSNFENKKLLFAVSIRCPNKKCGQYTLNVTLSDLLENSSGKLESKHHKSWQLIPESSARPFPEYIPEQIRADYTEACLIMNKSPKASATLSRRCLQGMIRDFYGIKEKNLKLEIEQLEGRIDSTDWKAIDAVRSIGNIGAHMEKDINLIVEVEPKEAELLVQLIETLFKDWYIVRHQREERMERLIELAQKKRKGDSPQ